MLKENIGLINEIVWAELEYSVEGHFPREYAEISAVIITLKNR